MDLLKSFHVFQKVAELGSFSRAANALGVVPSAVSRQINELEEWAGLRLVNRTTRSLHLSAEGQVYLEKLKQITADVQHLKSLGETEQGLVGHINLTAPMMLGQFVLPDTLARFQEVHPEVGISVTLINRTVDILEEGFDVAVRAGHLTDSSLMSQTVGSISMTTIASHAYLERFGWPQEPKDLTAHNCLISDPTAQSARWSFRTDGKDFAVRVSGSLRANDSLCLKALSLAGVGIARIPRQYVSKELDADALIEILPEYAPPAIPLNVVHHYGRRARPALRAFVDFMADDLRRAASDKTDARSANRLM